MVRGRGALAEKERRARVEMGLAASHRGFCLRMNGLGRVDKMDIKTGHEQLETERGKKEKKKRRRKY